MRNPDFRVWRDVVSIDRFWVHAAYYWQIQPKRLEVPPRDSVLSKTRWPNISELG